MRQYLYWVAISALFWSPITYAEQPVACDPWAAKVASVQGKVEAQRLNTTTWVAVKRDQHYCPGDKIRVDTNARASIILINETLVRLDQHTSITLSEINEEEPSILDLITGIAHFISRVPRSLKVNTPLINAAIEGTEFVIQVNDKEATVTVFEGTVLTQNSQGEVRLTNNETARATANSAPQKVLLAKPRDTVQWALYFPPIIDANEANAELRAASQLLYVGRVAQAQTKLNQVLQTEPNNGIAKALQAIIAVVTNQAEQALSLAQQATQLAPKHSAPYIALSYAQQATLQLDSAAQSAQQAVNLAPNQTLAWARLAELQLSLGQLDTGLASAKRAIELDPAHSRSQTVLGFAYLIQLRTWQARFAFERAIELDQVDPLPRLGLGLAKIRTNQLTQGRRDIEVAASLDPNNAIIRSYLGKAYFEEVRTPLDAEQFAMAKALDPNDPTPWFYDALRKQTQNRPIEALNDLKQSIALNDNRAVYRSSLQLDQDEAARSANLAQIYQGLGFEQTAINEASKSLITNPSSDSAHRFLSDAYINKARHGTARASELLQAQLLQPINTLPIRPQSTQANVPVLRDAGPSNSSSSDLTPLFTRNSSHLLVDTVVGGNDTRGVNAILSGLHGIYSYSIGAYNYDTDGFRTNNDLHEDIKNIFLQAQFNPNFSLQTEYRKRKTDNGDLDMDFDPTDFSTVNRRTSDKETRRVGGHYLFNDMTLVFSVIDTELNTSQQLLDISPSNSDVSKSDSLQTELQLSSTLENLNFTVGINKYEIDTVQSIIFDWTNVFGFTCPPSPPFPSVECERNIIFSDEHKSAYAYTNFEISNIILSLGLSHDDLTQRNHNIDQISPKLGLSWQLNEDSTFRLAYFENINKILTTKQTIEPTQVAGFNQFFDEANGAIAENYALAVESRLSDKIDIGVLSTYRDMDIPQFSGASFLSYTQRKEKLYQIYMNWLLSNNLALNLQLKREEIFNSAPGPDYLLTHSAPLTLSWQHSAGFSSKVTFVYVNQEVDLGSSSSFAQTQEDFSIVNLGLKYHFPKRAGSLGIMVHNLFGTNFLYQDTNFINTEPEQALYVPEQVAFIKVQLNF